MSATADEYRRVLEGFCEHVERMRDDVEAVLLFGSMARGDVRPGLSDVLDIFLCLKPEAFEVRERFLRCLELMVAANEQIIGSGLPAHPFFYWEDAGSLPAVFLPPFLSPRTHRNIFRGGAEVSPGSSDASRFYARHFFFEVRRRSYPLTVYLSKEHLTGEDRKNILEGLIAAHRYVPMTACMTLDLWVPEPEYLSALEGALPGTDASIFKKLERVKYLPEDATSDEELLGLLRETFDFVEELNRRLLSRLKERAAGRSAG